MKNMSEEPANLSPDQQVSQQPHSLVDSVSGVTPTEVTSATTAQPTDGSEYHGGYAGKRLSADGTSPNVPVINDPAMSDELGAAARQVQGQDQSETPKQ